MKISIIKKPIFEFQDKAYTFKTVSFKNFGGLNKLCKKKKKNGYTHLFIYDILQDIYDDVSVLLIRLRFVKNNEDYTEPLGETMKKIEQILRK